MQIDWITVSAQIVNFLILVWLFKRFLYGPIINAMDRRERRIADRLENARRREEQAEQSAADYRDKKESLEEREKELLEEARREADEERKRLLDAAREQVEASKRDWRKEADREKEEFLRSLRRQAAEGITVIARRVLGDLAGRELEQSIVDTFLERLQGLDEQAAKPLREGPVEVLSAFDLDEAQRERVMAAIRDQASADVEVEFERFDALVCGITLRAGGSKISWSVGDYLDDLEQQLARRLAERATNPEPGDAR